MSVIEYSPSASITVGQSIIKYSVNGTSSAPWACGFLQTYNTNSYNPFSGLYVMKGAVPTNFSTLTDFSVCSSDVLAFWFNGINSVQAFTGCINSNPFTLMAPFTNVTTSGTATWFWWLTRAANGNNPSTGLAAGAPIQQIVGTVGTVGSGSDLEIVSTNLVAGSPIRIINFQLAMPTTWTY